MAEILSRLDENCKSSGRDCYGSSVTIGGIALIDASAE
jgi:hypothetical protein